MCEVKIPCYGEGGGVAKAQAVRGRGIPIQCVKRAVVGGGGTGEDGSFLIFKVQKIFQLSRLAVAIHPFAIRRGILYVAGLGLKSLGYACWVFVIAQMTYTWFLLLIIPFPWGKGGAPQQRVKVGRGRGTVRKGGEEASFIYTLFECCTLHSGGPPSTLRVAPICVLCTQMGNIIHG